MDIKMPRDVSRGKKSKAGGVGEKIKSDSRIFTPVNKTVRMVRGKHGEKAKVEKTTM